MFVVNSSSSISPSTGFLDIFLGYDFNYLKKLGYAALLLAAGCCCQSSVVGCCK